MIIYKVPTRNKPEEDEDDGHTGFVWTLSKREAMKIYKNNGAQSDRGDDIQECELAVNKHDIIRFLNQHCDFPDNG